MTTSPVMSVTDELVADLEKEARLCDSDTSMFMDPALISALLAERAELKRDAERWKVVESAGGYLTLQLHYSAPRNRAKVIDAAMQPEASL